MSMKPVQHVANASPSYAAACQEGSVSPPVYDSHAQFSAAPSIAAPLQERVNTGKNDNTCAQKISRVRSLLQGKAVAPKAAPATEATLKIQGISVLLQDGMAFPVGHVLPMGQPGDISDYTPSEAFGYAMRTALEAGDRDFYQQLLNGYLFLVNQTTIYRTSIGWPLSKGLIGWSPNIMNVQRGLSPYPANLPNQFVSAASDADEDILRSMVDAAKKWPDMVATDKTTKNPDIPSKSISDLTLQSLQTFVANDLGTFSFNGKEYYSLTLDSWGHDVVFPDYFDPMTFVKMITFINTTMSDTDPNKKPLLDNLQKAAQGTTQFVQDVAQANGNWIPDTPYNLGGAASFGYDAVRSLMRYGEYLRLGSDPLGIKNQVQDVLKVLVQNIFNNVQWTGDGSLLFTPNGLSYGQFTGPLLVALKALQDLGQLPDNVKPDDVTKLENCLMKNDLARYDISSMQNWQNTYFAIDLALVSVSILQSTQGVQKPKTSGSSQNHPTQPPYSPALPA
jgi:endo-1,4-beta-D-glucanase Y